MNKIIPNQEFKSHSNKPLLFIVSAPSGAGKTTLLQKLLKKNPRIHLTVSYTTRTPREGEVNGVHYRFINVDEFEHKIAQNDFAEYAKVHDNYYGTPKIEIEKYLNLGQDVIAEIDWQGARALRQIFPFAVTLFILPPSLEELKNRLTTRAKDTPDIIAKRIAKATAEIAQVNEFDYVLINDNFENAVDNINIIFRSAKFLRKQQLNLQL